MKMRNKGKVHPSSSSSQTPPFPATSPAGDSLSVLNLLPAAILSLAVVLSLEDREVLAYMLTRSIKSATKKKTLSPHTPPVFDCDCFDCYTSYWFKWDTSVNRELIHQAIEAFEENLSSTEQSKKKGKKKDKTSNRRLAGKTLAPPLPEYDVALVEPEPEPEAEGCSCSCPEEGGGGLDGAEEELPEMAVVVRAAAAGHQQQHKGLARKVLPDVIGLVNWRLWSLWNPNV